MSQEKIQGEKFAVKAFEHAGEKWLKMCVANEGGKLLLVHLNIEQLSDRLDDPRNPTTLVLTANEVFDKQNLNGSFFSSVWVQKKKKD